ncbi:MAG: alanine/glycine:cation symporter family protein [Bacteroidota bacterium]
MVEHITEIISKITSVTEWIMLFLIIGGGVFLVCYSGFKPYRYGKHALKVVSGTLDKNKVEGEITHFQALSSVIAATVGLGNISGVAIAIYYGGPGVVFWMWITALIGACIKFYSCSLSIFYRKKEKDGTVYGGPMYYMTLGLKFGKPFAILFCVAGLIGMLPAFTANQLTQTLMEVIQPNRYIAIGDFYWKCAIGFLLVLITSFVIFGGLKKIAEVASLLVPFMVVIYFIAAIVIISTNTSQLLPSLALIFKEAFNINTAVQGGLWALIILGVRRAVFSNESGVGSAPMYHGQSKTDEPVQEGLVGMLGPFIDTLIVCTVTAIVIIISGEYLQTGNNGIIMTLRAFEQLLFGFGGELLMLLVIVFGISTLFTYSYYGTKCLGFLAGNKTGKYYNYLYILSIIFAAIASVDLVIGLIDLGFAFMSIPNMIAILILAPKVNAAMKSYFKKLHEKT